MSTRLSCSFRQVGGRCQRRFYTILSCHAVAWDAAGSVYPALHTGDLSRFDSPALWDLQMLQVLRHAGEAKASLGAQEPLEGPAVAAAVQLETIFGPVGSAYPRGGDMVGRLRHVDFR